MNFQIFEVILLVSLLTFSGGHSNSIKNYLKELGKGMKDPVQDEFGLVEDYDYELDDNTDKFKTLNDRTLIYFVENFKPEKNDSEQVTGVSSSEIMTLVNTRPEVVVLLSQVQLEGILIHRPEMLKGISRVAAEALATSQTLADKIAKLPKKLMADFMIKNVFVQDFLKFQLAKVVSRDSHLPSIVYLQKLLLDENFLRLIPMKLHVELAESDFVHFINVQTIKAVLKAKPDIILHLGSKGLKFASLMLKNPDFVNHLSCAVILNGATSPALINRLSNEDIKIFAKSENFWKCLPIDVIRHIMMHNNLGTRISVNDVIIAAKVLYQAKKIDQQIIVSMLTIQFPQLAERGLSDIFD